MQHSDGASLVSRAMTSWQHGKGDAQSTKGDAQWGK